MESAICSGEKVNPFGSITFYDEIVSSLVNHFLLELSELYWCCLTIYQGKEYSVREKGGSGKESDVKKKIMVIQQF